MALSLRRDSRVPVDTKMEKDVPEPIHRVPCGAPWARSGLLSPTDVIHDPRSSLLARRLFALPPSCPFPGRELRNTDTVAPGAACTAERRGDAGCEKPVVPAWMVRESDVVRTYDFAGYLGTVGQPCPPAENKLRTCDLRRRNRPRCGIIRDSLPEAGSCATLASPMARSPTTLPRST